MDYQISHSNLYRQRPGYYTFRKALYKKLDWAMYKRVDTFKKYVWEIDHAARIEILVRQ